LIYAQQVTFSKIFSNYPLNPENGWNIHEVPSGYLLISANECLDQPNYNCTSIILLDFNGNIVWHKNVEQSLGYQASHISVVADKIFLAGRSNDDQTQFSLSCFDINGNFLWRNTYGNSKNEWPAGIVRTRGADNILYGDRDRNQNHMYEWLPVLMKISLQGDSITEFTFNEQYDASSVKQVIESTQRDLIASYVYCPNGCVLDLKAGVISLDSLGNTKWVLDLPYSFSPYGCLVNQIDSNTLAIKWHIDSTIPNYDLTPPAIFFTDMFGIIQDTFVFQNQTLKEVRYMAAVWENGLVGSGSNYVDLNLSKNAGWIFRMDKNREIFWDRTYLDTTYNADSYGLNQIIPTSDGGYIATGTITNFMTGVWESHNWVLKLDSLGCLEPNCGGLNYVTKTEEAVFLKGKGIKIYPNPAVEYATIEFPMDFNLKGLILTLVSNEGKTIKQTSVNSNFHRLQISGLVAGTYYAIITRGNEIITSKQVIVHH
jgi:hypothetical protein